jgi:hypothetical protein
MKGVTARSDQSSTGAHDGLCAVMRGEDVPISAAILEAARQHDMHLVLAQANARTADDGIRAALAADVRAAAIADLLREAELRRVLGRLAAAGIHTLVLKGAALAYTVYRAPHLRPRGDVDLLVAPLDIDAADHALVAGGWLRAVEHDSAAITTQRHYVLGGTPRIAEHLDLHWKIAVPRIFSEALRFDELASRAVPITALGPDAWTLSPADALFLACLHRVAHHQDAADLLWLWDIHLLAFSLSEAERAAFIALADERAMRAVCARGLELALARFATPRAAELIGSLQPLPDDAEEPSATFLRGGMRQVDLLRSDLSTVRNWRAGITLLRAHLFPNAAYVKALYPRWPAAALPLAYLDRIVRGAPKWFRGPVE